MKKHYHKTSLLSMIVARAITNAVVPPKKGIPRSKIGAEFMIGKAFMNWWSGKK